jgi:hypothetical protein
MTTVAGSTVEMGAMSTTPAPTRLRRLMPPLPRLRLVNRVTSTRPEVRAELAAVPSRAGARPQVSQ